jgi:glycosyltransferase involved in cell wall biosynthesis
MELNEPLISVIIPHLNQPDMLDACLASLDEQSLGHTAFEVLVVDNGSASLPQHIVSRHPGTRLLYERQPGPGPARNTGARNAASRVLAFIDADCRAHRDWLRSALQALRSAPDGTILGGDVRIWRNNSNGFTALEAYESVFAYRFKLYIERQGFAGTGNMMVHRADFEEVGAFAGIQLAEDMEWGQRACGAGFRFRYVPEMIVFHPARRSLGELYAKWDRQIQHYLNMAQGEPAWRIRWIIRALAILGSPAIDFAKVLGSDRIQGISARFKAIGILIAIRTYRARTMLSLLQERKAVVWNREAGM